MATRRKRDYYVVLGITKDASEADVKRAFRELARKHHPDVNPEDAGEAFREINEAYAVLSNRDSRARYDRWGHPGEDNSSGLGAVVDAAQDMFNEILRRRRGKQKGADTRYTLEVTFEEAAFGTEKTITIPAAGQGPGQTLSAKPREIKIVVPTGTKDGATKVVKGEGEPGKLGSQAGDLQVSIRVAEHPKFRRDGLDVHSDYTITFAQAALGAVLDLPTLDGDVKMRIPEGTQPGRAFRIRGRGIPQASGKNAPRGDHLVHVQVEVPTELTQKQRELIEELARASGEETAVATAPKKRLLDRVRSLLDE
ncbi:MAG TPA: J domain-containing protein [Kofleriaceae bacterium]|nr:J domain-containing protein [Kofleriaceae bacterium]